MILPGVLLSAKVSSSLSNSLRVGLPVRQLFIWMQPSIEELMTQPEELKRILIFQQMSIKIQLALFLLTETDEAEELMVLGEKKLKLLPIFLRSIMLPDLASIISLAIRGLIWEVLVSWGCPKSIISSNISQTSTKFLRMVYSLMIPQKSLIMTTILFKSYSIQEGDTLKRVVATTQIDDFFKYAKLMPSMLNIGQTSPLDSLTLRQKSSGVFLMRSDLKSRLMMESPLADRKNICEIIYYIKQFKSSGPNLNFIYINEPCVNQNNMDLSACWRVGCQKTEGYQLFSQTAVLIMEKKNQKQINHITNNTNSMKHSKNAGSTTKIGKKSISHKKIYTQAIDFTENTSVYANMPNQGFTRSQNNIKLSKERLQTAANTMSTWSFQTNNGLAKQMSKINQQMKEQNQRVKNFLKLLKPQLDLKMGCYKSNALTKVSLSQKIKSQCLILQKLASDPCTK